MAIMDGPSESSSSTERLYICSNHSCESFRGNDCGHTKPHPYNDDCNVFCSNNHRCLLINKDKNYYSKENKVIISKSTAKATRHHMRNK